MNGKFEQITKARRKEQDQLLLALLHVLREPLQPLEQTLSCRCTTRNNVSGENTEIARVNTRTLDGHTTTCRAFCVNRVSP